MSENVEVTFDGKAHDKAVLLLAAAQELGLPASVVQTKTGAFLAPEEVVQQAFGTREAEQKSDSEQAPKPAKKSTAKKSTAKAQE